MRRRPPKPAPHAPAHLATPAAVAATAPPELPYAGPRHAATPVRGLVVLGDETIRVPGIGAYLRRHPKFIQRGGIGAVVTGITLFVVASVTTPLASANTAGPSTPTPTPSAATPALDPLPTPATAAGAHEVLSGRPVHAAKQAPANHVVISGLAANGIPNVALNAYRVAAARMHNVQPGCGIDWALLAGIGREESDHGRFGGAVLHADGVSTPRIIGPALDGIHWDYVPAPANGLALDGDARYAHALGPMQFIPSTWAGYGSDANGDGKADVFNINDAALGAARYLCAAGGNLRARAGQVRAVLAYNHSDQYLAQVLALADAYRRGVPVTGLPVGITTGPLPKVADTGYLPPANPAAPTAVQRSSGHQSAPAPTGSSSAGHRSGGGATGTSAPTAGSTPTPAPSTSSAAPKPGGTTSTPKPSPTPTPSPTKSCNPLQILFCRP